MKARPVVLAAPSGTGKTTIAHRLVEGSDDFVFSVSATTRAPRAGERQGVDYHFVDRDRFMEMVEKGELVEWAEVHGRLYGTPRSSLEDEARDGRHVVLDIDVQGAAQIRERVPGALLVFVLPPSAEALLERLGRRGTEDRVELARRLRNALSELGRIEAFDHVVVNDDLDATVDQIRRLVRTGQGAPSPGELRERVRALENETGRVLRERFAGAAS